VRTAFDGENEAQAFLDDYLKNVDHGYRWSDWDEYGIRELESGRG